MDVAGLGLWADQELLLGEPFGQFNQGLLARPRYPVQTDPIAS